MRMIHLCMYNYQVNTLLEDDLTFYHIKESWKWVSKCILIFIFQTFNQVKNSYLHQAYNSSLNLFLTLKAGDLNINQC